MMVKTKMKQVGVGLGLTGLGAAILLTVLLTGCVVSEKQAEPAPVVYKAHYLDDGATLQVEDPYLQGAGKEKLSLLENFQKVSKDLEAECEKNALLAQELIALRDARDQLKTDLDSTRTQSIDLNEQIAGLKISIADHETELSLAHQEKRDLIEKLVNLRIEKTKVEKELLKVKIAALSGDG